jgi:hypothetical protein
LQADFPPGKHRAQLVAVHDEESRQIGFGQAVNRGNLRQRQFYFAKNSGVKFKFFIKAFAHDARAVLQFHREAEIVCGNGQRWFEAKRKETGREKTSQNGFHELHQLG